MKTMYICICSGFYKHGWILLKPGVQVSIGHYIIDNENRVTGRSPKNAKMGIFGQQEDTYVVVG
jgi:hypothetical protein